jgi:hypothetical protein
MVSEAWSDEMCGHSIFMTGDFDTLHAVPPTSRDDFRLDRNQKMTQMRYYHGLILDTNEILDPLVSGEDGSGLRSAHALPAHLTMVS